MIHRIGSDECGYGALCGPITVCAFLAPQDWDHPAVKDSKKYTNRAARDCVAKMLRQDSECWYSIVSIEADEVDRLGYTDALAKAHCTAVMDCVGILLPQDKYEIIIDGNLEYPLEVAYRSEPKADGKYKHVGAASILAKSWRDEVMVQHAKAYPQYGFEHNSGYGTAKHLEALKKHGPCPIHRMSISPMKDM